MNQEKSQLLKAVSTTRVFLNVNSSRCIRLGLMAALGASFMFGPRNVQHAQQQQRFKEPTVKVTGIAASGGNVSISADGSLNRAQTWQDKEGFHIVLVNGEAGLAANTPHGVKVRHIGNSLELVVPVSAGASVSVQPHGNRLDLEVGGGSVTLAPVEERKPQGKTANDNPVAQPSHDARERAPRVVQPGDYVATWGGTKRQNSSALLNGESAASVKKETPPSSTNAAAEVVAPNNLPLVNVAPAPAAGAVNNPLMADANINVKVDHAANPPANAASVSVESNGEANTSYFSMTALLAALGTGLSGATYLVLRRRRRRLVDFDDKTEKRSRRASSTSLSLEAEAEQKPFELFRGDRRQQGISVPFERRRTGGGAEDEALRHLASFSVTTLTENGQQASQKSNVKVGSMATPAVEFGAYKIDQEIMRLVMGDSHNVEILASRVPDDRRAIETSLMKALRAPELDEDGRRRARMALEDYGLVARQCATLLLGTDTYDRVSAARSLGELRSAQALPFLTEALYDGDAVVRTEAVQSLGALGLPSAIGALLDMARRHPDVPSSILGPALTACSVESLETNRGMSVAGGALMNEDFSGEIKSLEPIETVEPLPEWLEDESLRAALNTIDSEDVETRVAAAQMLAQFQVRCAVEALTSTAMRDADPAVRAAAVTSLGTIDHESVFAPVLIGMGDDAREVRAAAARALSRLSFERADAYVRVIESADREMLREVAQACVKAGVAAQAVSRLSSEDRRQAYESYAVLSLLLKGGEAAAVLDAVENHHDLNVRMVAARLCGSLPEPEMIEQLKRIAARTNVPEKVRAVILDTIKVAELQAVEA